MHCRREEVAADDHPDPDGAATAPGAELRRLREEAGLTIDRVAEALECSQSKVSRIETGQVSATPRDVRDMLELYRVDDDRREALVQVAREARQRGWWQKFVDVPDGVPAYVGLETAATSIDIYMSLIVPALLQTADYAKAVIGAVRPDLPRPRSTAGSSCACAARPCSTRSARRPCACCWTTRWCGGRSEDRR